MKPKSTLIMTANLQGIPMDRYNLQGRGIRIPSIPKVKIGTKRNIYA